MATPLFDPWKFGSHISISRLRKHCYSREKCLDIVYRAEICAVLPYFCLYLVAIATPFAPLKIQTAYLNSLMSQTYYSHGKISHAKGVSIILYRNEVMPIWMFCLSYTIVIFSIFAKNERKCRIFLFPPQKGRRWTRLLSHKSRKSVKRCDLCKTVKNNGGVKNIHGCWQFHAYAAPPPLRVEILKCACGVWSPT